MPNLGPMELIIILAIVLIIFGIGRLPEMGKTLGKGMREFRKAQSGLDDLKKIPRLELDDLTKLPELETEAPQEKAEVQEKEGEKT
jgi:sec-independent protein translocase protein TatA